MVRGQRAWDAAMARSILRAREGVARDRTVVVVVGMGHVAHGLGIPERLAAAQPGPSVRVLCPVSAERPEPQAQVHPGFEASETATFSAGLADYVYVLPDEAGEEAYPRFGVTLEQAEGSADLRVSSVEEGSVAARAGIRSGDVLTAISGEPVTSLAPTRLRLSRARWDERLELSVRRAGATLLVPVLLVPPTDGPGRWLESSRASWLLDGFDPRGARPVVDEPAAAAGLPCARVVRMHDRPVRLDVLDGSRLEQAWKLDAAGRPVLGLFAAPAADGAVRVELTRDSEGKVVTERRLDAAGELLVAEPAGAKVP
jgi:hypothetical protein